MARFDKWNCARCPHGADKGDGKFVRDINHVQQDAVAFFKRSGIMDEQAGQFVITRIGHN